MLKAIFSTLRFIILILAGNREIALENAAFVPFPSRWASQAVAQKSGGCSLSNHGFALISTNAYKQNRRSARDSRSV
jgi:hypothetical protein